MTVTTMAGPRAPRPLTAWQLQVLQLAADGLTGDAIARRLGSNRKQIVVALRRAGDKLGAVNTTNAVAIAYQRGILRADRDGAAA